MQPAHETEYEYTGMLATTEIIRAIDSLQLTDSHSVSTPVNWNPGERVVISPKLSDEDARAKYPQGYETLRPYLRLVDLEAAG